MNTELVAVPIGPCACDGTPHDEGDVVMLRPKVGLEAGVVMQSRIVSWNEEQLPSEVITGRLIELYVTYGVADWNLTNGNGGPVEVTPETIKAHLLDDFERATPVASKADDLYKSAVLDPLRRRRATPSPTSTTGRSTSASPDGTSKRRKQSKRSSTSTTPTDDTEMTSK